MGNMIEGFDNNRRITGDDRVVRNGLGDDAAGGDDAVFADSHALEDDGVESDPRMGPDPNGCLGDLLARASRPHRMVIVTPRQRIERVAIVVENLNPVRDQRMLADLNGGGGTQQAIVAKVNLRFDHDSSGTEFLDSQQATTDHVIPEANAVAIAGAIDDPGVWAHPAAGGRPRVGTA